MKTESRILLKRELITAVEQFHGKRTLPVLPLLRIVGLDEIPEVMVNQNVLMIVFTDPLIKDTALDHNAGLIIQQRVRFTHKRHHHDPAVIGNQTAAGKIRACADRSRRTVRCICHSPYDPGIRQIRCFVQFMHHVNFHQGNGFFIQPGVSAARKNNPFPVFR